MKALAIGIDIGGTKMAIAVVGRDGRIVSKIVLPTDSQLGISSGLTRICDGINAALQKASCLADDVCGIGVGCAGPVNPQRGTIENPYTLPGWDNFNIVAGLHERFGTPVHLENDADAALLGECFSGAGRNHDPVVMLTFGTGIGGAVVSGGRIYRGVTGSHPEIGHIPIDPDGPECYCGIRGCFEAIASGTAIGKAGEEAKVGDSRMVFIAAAAGNPSARAIVSRAVRATTTAVWTIVHTFVPQRIVLGGGLMESHYNLFSAPILNLISRSTQAPVRQITLAKAELGNDAGLVGAASLAFKESMQ